MLKIYNLILLGIILFLQYPKLSFSQSRNIDPEIQKKIDDFIQDVYLPIWNISGFGLAIAQDDGEILYTTGYGMADIEKGIPTQNSTQFLIGSVTKSFTAVLTVKLLHEKFPDLGESVLDTPIRRLLPDANLTLIDRFRSEHVTFRDLLAHRVCLVRADMGALAGVFDTVEKATYHSRYTQELCGFRGDFQYNNEMYTMAGELAGILADKPYEDAMQDLLIEIGMTNSAFVQETDDFSQMPFRAMPYYIMDNEAIPMNTDLVKRGKLVNAAGSLYSPPEDMAKWMRFHLNLGTIDGKEIIPKEVMEWTRKPSNMVTGYMFKQSEDDLVINQFGYGLGLFISDYDGWEYIQHGGYFMPYRSLMSLYPTKNLAIFTSTNNGPSHPAGDVMVLHAFIFETMMGNEDALEKAMKLQKTIDAKKEIEMQEARNNFNAFDDKMANVAAGIVGKYGSGSLGELEISEKFNQGRNRTEYYIDYGRWYKGWLEELEQGTIFRVDFETDVIQDDYSEGRRTSAIHVAVHNDTLTIFTSAGNENLVMGIFKLGFRSDLLPPVPWNPDSCGPETF